MSLANEKDLTSELKCECGGYLKPPIKLCMKGHGLCNKCWRKLQACSICQSELTEIRSVALEALVDKLYFPCPHEGCVTRVPLKDLEEHSSDCNMRPTSCFMARVYSESCEWVGLAADWLDHCIEMHPDRIGDSTHVRFDEMWSPKSNNPIMRYHLLRCYDKVFNIYQIYDTKSAKMMWSIIMSGNDNHCHTYYFDLEIHNPKDYTRRISFRQLCKNGTELDILDSNQNVLLSLEQIIYMLDDEKFIHYKITITEREEPENTDAISQLEENIETLSIIEEQTY